MCDKIKEIINKTEKKYLLEKLLQFIVGNCPCEHCHNLYKKREAIITIRKKLRYNFKEHNDKKLKSISDKEIDFLLRKWMHNYKNDIMDKYQAISYKNNLNL